MKKYLVVGWIEGAWQVNYIDTDYGVDALVKAWKGRHDCTEIYVAEVKKVWKPEWVSQT